MKQLQIFTGGHPRNADDLVHMQAGMVEAIISLVKGLLSNGASIPNCVLYGVNITASGGGFTTYGAGAVILGGEICQFDATTVASALAFPHHYVLKTSDSFLAGNPVTYADTSTHNVHLIRKAVIADITVATGANEIELDDRLSFNYYLKSNLFGSADAWHIVGDVGSPAFNGSFDVYPLPGPLRYCKLISGMVIIEGGMNFDYVSSVANFVDINTTTPLVIFTLPDGWRPDVGSAFQEVAVQTPGGWATFSVQVYDNGDVALNNVYAISGGLTPGDFSAGLSVARLYMMFRAAV